MKTILVSILILMTTTVFADNCKSNSALNRSGFATSDNFKASVKLVNKWMQQEWTLFQDDLNSVIFSSSANALVRVKTMDYTATPQDVMWGDVVVMTDFKTKKIVEVRWFKNGKKYFSYDKNYQECATNVIPMAYNTLF